MTTLDLSAYTACGFPGDCDRGIAEVGVAGIDKQQAHSMIRVCPDTEALLYGPDYSPTRITYRKGSRPELEKIAAELRGPTHLARAQAAMAWVIANVPHPHYIAPLEPDRGMTEEQLIDSGVGYCNEQTRVFIALCEVMEIPARICFVFHANLVCGHTCAEVYLDGRWVFFDVTFGVTVELPDGRMAEGRDLAGAHRGLAHKAYRSAIDDYNAQVKPWVENVPGWRSSQRPTRDAGGDLLAYLGICNYLIEGAQAA